MKMTWHGWYPTIATVAVALGLTASAAASSSLSASQETASARETMAVLRTTVDYAPILPNRANLAAPSAVDITSHQANTSISAIEVVRLDRADLGAHRNAGIAHQKKSDVARTLDEYSKIIQEDPMDDDAYFRRGITYFYAGFPLRALADLQMANKLDPDYPYYPLWIDILDRRSHRESALSEAASRMDMTKWPSPVIRLFLGELDSGAVLSAADDKDETKKQEQTCEANFYIGVLALQQGEKEEAARRFRSAATDCPSDFVEAPSALAELDALGMTAR